LHNEDGGDRFLESAANHLQDNSLPNTVKIIKSRTMRWAGYGGLIGEMRNVYKILIRKPEGKNHLEDLGVDGRVILTHSLHGI
jgi:hypothetical protein